MPNIYRIIKHRPRLTFSIIVGLLIGILLPNELAQRTISRIIIAWNSGVILYLLLSVRMMFYSSTEKMKYRARKQDEGKILILALVVLAALGALASLFYEIATIKELSGNLRYWHIALVGISIANAWLFIHVMFALHYAHEYYMALHKKLPGGLLFPAEEAPDYADFIYFSFIIGTSAQTADVSFTSKNMRRIGLIQSVLAFFFNTTILSLTINIASGLL